jgi:hypothetical protein
MLFEFKRRFLDSRGVILIFTFVLVLVATSHAPDRQHVKATIRKPLQRIAIVSPKCCWVSDLWYQDDRIEKKIAHTDLNDVWTETESGGPNFATSTSVCRNYLGDATIWFNLNGPPCRNGLHFDILNDNRPRIDKFYAFDIKFDKSGSAPIVIQMKNNMITNIYQDKPRYETYYQYAGPIDQKDTTRKHADHHR